MTAIALVPGKREPRFVFLDVPDYARVLLSSPPLPIFGRESSLMPVPIVAKPLSLSLPWLGWRGVVHVAPGEEARLFEALRAAESVILFLAWLSGAWTWYGIALHMPRGEGMPR